MVGGCGSEALTGRRSRRGTSAVRAPAQAATQATTGPPQIFLDSNENPYGPCAASLDAIRGTLGDACRYPHNFVDLIAALAKLHGVQAGEHRARLRLGRDSPDGGARVHHRQAGRCVQGHPTFESPARDAELSGAPVVNVPVDAGLKLDLRRHGREGRRRRPRLPLQPEQPDRHRARRGRRQRLRPPRARSRRRPPCILVDEAYHRLHRGPGLPHRAAAGAPDTRRWWWRGRSRRSTAWRGSAWATPSATPTR